MADKRKSNLRNNLTQLLLGIVIIVLINIIGSYVFTRFDLTSEKRYTLSDATKELLKDLDDIVYFKIYLEGEFPAGFKRLKSETREMLDEFRAYSENIQYEFINPSESTDAQERNDTYRLLMERGLNPTELQVNKNDGTQQQIIFPGAIATYKERDLPLELLQSQMGVPSESVLNNSIQSLEFNLVNTIKKLSVLNRKSIAFISGHGELENDYLADIYRALSEYYAVERVSINGQINSLTKRAILDTISKRTSIRNKYEAIVIAKPDSVFSEQDKFILDQYIMRGGKVLWLIDAVQASMDSLQFAESTMGVSRDLNIDDLLFKYGVRINNNLLMDLNALPIPLRTGQVGNQPKIDFFPWYFFPIITPLNLHPIVKNLNAIKTEFVSSIDTINNPGIKKTILLKTSSYSRTVNTPTYISLRMLREEPDERLFRKPGQAIAVLLEGEFESVFKNRIPPELQNDPKIGFMGNSKPTRQIVVSDGDIIKNQLHNTQKYPLPLGYDQFTGQTFGNREFILNAMNYLTDGEGIIEIRSRELKLRLLDTKKINEQRTLWQVLNTILPVILIIVFGVVQGRIRKKKYTGKIL